MKKSSFIQDNLENLELSYETFGEHLLVGEFEQNEFSHMEISLMLYDETDECCEKKDAIATAHITKIPSSYTYICSKAWGIQYDTFSALEESGNADLEVIGEELNPDSYVAHSPTDEYLEDNNIYYVSEFKVNPEFRNMGVGLFFMKTIHKWLRQITSEYFPIIVLIPSPIEIKKDAENYEEEKRRLVKFYKKAGMKKLRRNGEVMYFAYPQNETF